MEHNNYGERLMHIGPEMQAVLNQAVLDDLAVAEQVALIARMLAENNDQQQNAWKDRVYIPRPFVIGCV